MLKVVIFDSGYGGESIADRLSEEIPVIDVIRVIDWRHAKEIQESAKEARSFAEEALRPYIGKVDLIIFANYLLSITSLKYFAKKYENQEFLGLGLEKPCTFVKRDTLILTTQAITKTFTFKSFIFGLRNKAKVLTLEDWPARIDDGELQFDEIKEVIRSGLTSPDGSPVDLILMCSQFIDIAPELKKAVTGNVQICDGTREIFSSIYKKLHLRGGSGRKLR